MNYISGEQVAVGDSVMIEHGRTPGRVHAVIESPEDRAEWGLEAPCIMVATTPFDLVAWPASDAQDPLIFVERERP
ncbi:MAG: hypothetical protein ABWY06_21880 [Pseudomonas sp.]|uniref:hypothetical protein n=1 Tax=Pseudomonas sp. TaxID=306 RepID=UPI0033973070